MNFNKVNALIFLLTINVVAVVQAKEVAIQYEGELERAFDNGIAIQLIGNQSTTKLSLLSHTYHPI